MTNLCKVRVWKETSINVDSEGRKGAKAGTRQKITESQLER